MAKIDLHIHTVCSDGALTPKEVIDMAVKNGVSVISITDHDTIDAYNDELYNYAEKKNIKLINGVEISTKTKKCGIHVLGYNLDLNNENFKTTIDKLKNIRHDYLKDVSNKLDQLGYILDVVKLNKIEAVTKAHIALDIIENSDNKDLLINNFGHIPNKGEFIETIMNEGCKAYVEKKTISPKEAADLIRSAGGKVVLAHPVAYTYEDSLSETDVLEIAKDINADGIESYYLYVDRNNKQINDVDKWCKFAEQNNYFKTIGSDYHISDGLRPEIGLIEEQPLLNDKEITELINNIES